MLETGASDRRATGRNTTLVAVLAVAAVLAAGLWLPLFGDGPA